MTLPFFVSSPPRSTQVEVGTVCSARQVWRGGDAGDRVGPRGRLAGWIGHADPPRHGPKSGRRSIGRTPPLRLGSVGVGIAAVPTGMA